MFFYKMHILLFTIRYNNMIDKTFHEIGKYIKTNNGKINRQRIKV